MKFLLLLFEGHLLPRFEIRASDRLARQWLIAGEARNRIERLLCDKTFQISIISAVCALLSINRSVVKIRSVVGVACQLLMLTLLLAIVVDYGNVLRGSSDVDRPVQEPLYLFFEEYDPPEHLFLVGELVEGLIDVYNLLGQLLVHLDQVLPV